MIHVPPPIVSEQRERLIAILGKNRALQTVLDLAPQLELPDYYVGAGFVAQTVWNVLSGRHPTKDVKDIDIVYFDPRDLSEEGEAQQTRNAQALLQSVPLPVDVTNEARVHTWYGKAFGYEIEPYRSTEAAIQTWPSTATSIGIRRSGPELEIYAPFGLDDLLGLVVRPNKVQIDEATYARKTQRWSSCWPNLTVIPWGDG